MKIGIVDLDTSHPENWIPIERSLGHEIVGVWDGGSVHPAQYVRDFTVKHRIARVYSSLREMVSEVDCAIIHGCDWDTHLMKAQPFVEAGKSVLIDKPLAGRLADLRELQKLARGGTRITGGSSLRYCYELRDWLAKPTAERGTPHTAFVGCGVDEFNYGIHAYSLLCGIMGPGIRSARQLNRGVQRRIQVNWADGRVGFLVVGPAAVWLPFYATIATERSAAQLFIDANNLYRALLESTLPYLAGQTDQPPAPMEALIEAELCALAARRSWMNQDSEISLDEITDDDGYDGAAFAQSYRATRYPPPARLEATVQSGKRPQNQPAAH